MKLYVASSWRNSYQPGVVSYLRHHGHDIYDFRNPAVGDSGFHWSQISSHWQDWSRADYITALEHPAAVRGFGFDMEALRWCEGCVLVLPCGRSAHLEAGWAAGAGKPVIVYMPEPNEPELMYKMCAAVVTTPGEILDALAGAPREAPGA